MLATALATMLVGLDARPVRVEVDASPGVPSFVMVGLAEAAVRESRVRVRSALAGVGVDLGEWNVVVNLAPADVRKHGSAYDVAIAVAVGCAVGRAPVAALDGLLVLGELSLGGTLEPVRGVLAQLCGARARGVRRAVVPRANAPEAALVERMEVRCASALGELFAALRGDRALTAPARGPGESAPALVEDLADVRGQRAARRALEIAAAGGHHLLLLGPAGSGKTMLARRIPGILPPLADAEAIEVAAIHGVAGAAGGATRRTRPFRAPHHTASDAALVGGGEIPRPGEVTLAHHGVLFLDELGEFRRSALEALRQPLEDGVVAISRAQDKIEMPSAPLVVAATNGCPCAAAQCACAPKVVAAYRARISGPILDRLDLHVAVAPVDIAALHRDDAEPTDVVRARVLAARELQAARRARGGLAPLVNARLGPAELRRAVALDAEASRLFAACAEARAFSARAHDKVLRVARTIADLEGATRVGAVHLAEAVELRSFDRQPAAGFFAS